MNQELLSLLMGFHVRQDSRQHYEFDRAWFTANGKAAISSFYLARLFAEQISRKRDLINYPEQAVYASQVNGVALVQAITQYLFRAYRAQRAPNLLQTAGNWIQMRLGSERYEDVLTRFVEQFPPLAVASGRMDAAAFLSGDTDGLPNRELVLEEILLLWLANANPAFKPLKELFADADLQRATGYTQVMSEMYRFFDTRPAREQVGGTAFSADMNVIDLLLAPVRAAPDSLEGQLQFLLQNWGAMVGDYLLDILRGIDLIHEETKPVFVGGGGAGPVEVATAADYAAMEFEAENFTPDKDWMPNLILIAKNSYVWLDQLSRKYGRTINRLDQIPDEELRQFARWGITGLWLIGLWERSTASQHIKQMMGNPEAVASAYSLYGYKIAEALGGEAACDDLRRRAWRYGIRLASDMVPNHVGIDGEWVLQHPDWFLSVRESPYPSYSFNGPDLSSDPRVGIFIEDHYYSKSDAAVVFKRVDRWTGDTRYIYHGNDGTSMPWNDTAQLDYLSADVREAMIQLILHIAKQFPIIRFDAAMTLVKRHIARLWFPEPGTGGAIPSRAEHGMTKAEFDALMPQEFWREVVDRAAVEAPDTLLLAEAFWMMEGYFVRTLGMHRVYNSAFMNLLRDEDNERYRWVMKNTLEFDPEVLRRYVNFMNNPDERTAVDQFGKGDKYFGIATLMMTMPGLPMFGHGQIEGFNERYGMEYRRAYYDEQIDGYLVERHERELFPLAHKRALFAGVENFLLYDVYGPDGVVNEDIFAYSNRFNDERALIVYLNKYASSTGWIKASAAFSVKVNDAGDRALIQKSLADGLGLTPGSDQYIVFRDQRAGLEYIRRVDELIEQGMYIELGAYQCFVFVDFRQVTATAAHPYDRLNQALNGRGVHNLSETLQEIIAAPVREPYWALAGESMIRRLLDTRALELDPDVATQTFADFEQNVVTLLHAVRDFTGALPVTEDVETDTVDPALDVAAETRRRVEIALRLSVPAAAEEEPLPEEADEAAEVSPEPVEAEFPPHVALSPADVAHWAGLIDWLIIDALSSASDAANPARQARSWIDEWRLGKLIADSLRQLGADGGAVEPTLDLIKLLTSHQTLAEGGTPLEPGELLAELLTDAEAQQFLHVNRYENVVWFNKEAFEQLLGWLSLIPRVALSDEAAIARREAALDVLADAVAQSDYQVEKLRAAVRQARSTSTV